MSFASTISDNVRKRLQKLGWDFHRHIPEELKGYPMRYEHIGYFLYYRRVFEKVHELDGDIVECGVGNGMSFLYFGWLARAEMKGRKVWGFDSFEGFPEPSVSDQSPRNPKKGEWNWVNIPRVLELLRRGGLDEAFIRSQMTLVKGFFNESLPKYRGNQIAMLHLDCDLYDSYKTSLEQLYKKVVRGGVICFDEYMNTLEHYQFPGAAKAIDDFLGPRVAWIQRDPTVGKYYLIKMED